MTTTVVRLRAQGYLTWQSVLAWLLLALVVLQMLLFFRITIPNAPTMLPTLLLYPLTTFGGVIVLLATARVHRGRRRLSTLLMAAALYFPWHLAWVGNALRVVLDSVTVGCAAFIFTYSWLPLRLRADPRLLRGELCGAYPQAARRCDPDPLPPYGHSGQDGGSCGAHHQHPLPLSAPQQDDAQRETHRDHRATALASASA